MKEPPKDKTGSMHHTVPKFYLKGFKDDDGHITVWDRKSGALRKNALKRTSALPGYYTVLDKNQNESDMVENFYSDLERDAKPIIERMTCIFPLVPPYGSKERIIMSFYLATQFVRTKQNRRKSQFLHDYIYKLRVTELLSNQKTPLTQQEIDFLHNPHKIGELKQPQDIYIRRELEMAAEIVSLFHSRQWMIVSFSEPRLITSDTPVALVSGAEQFPVGLENAPEYWFPVDNKHLLILSAPLCPYAFRPGKVINYSDIKDQLLLPASLSDMANSLQLQNCCAEAYGEKELLAKYEGHRLPAKKPFSTNRNTRLDRYYTDNDDLDWEPASGHDMATMHSQGGKTSSKF